MNIRCAVVADLEQLVPLAENAFRSAFASQNDPQDLDDYVRTTLAPKVFRDDLADDSNVFLIAEHQDEIAGYAKLHVETESLEIERLYAADHMIGRGVGAALMQASLDKAKELGRSHIWLGVWEHNPRAIEFYKRWGFDVVGQQSFELGSDIQNDLIMRREVRVDDR